MPRIRLFHSLVDGSSHFSPACQWVSVYSPGRAARPRRAYAGAKNYRRLSRARRGSRACALHFGSVTDDDAFFFYSSFYREQSGETRLTGNRVRERISGFPSLFLYLSFFHRPTFPPHPTRPFSLDLFCIMPSSFRFYPLFVVPTDEFPRAR